MPSKQSMSQDNNAFTYTITDLNPNTQYYYRMEARVDKGMLLNTDEGEFRTIEANEDIMNISNLIYQPMKVMLDGHLYILRDCKIYTPHGARVE